MTQWGSNPGPLGASPVVYHSSYTGAYEQHDERGSFVTLRDFAAPARLSQGGRSTIRSQTAEDASHFRRHLPQINKPFGSSWRHGQRRWLDVANGFRRKPKCLPCARASPAVACSRQTTNNTGRVERYDGRPASSRAHYGAAPRERRVARVRRGHGCSGHACGSFLAPSHAEKNHSDGGVDICNRAVVRTIAQVACSEAHRLAHPGTHRKSEGRASVGSVHTVALPGRPQHDALMSVTQLNDVGVDYRPSFDLQISTTATNRR
ncbi:hypothetical protein HPB51_022852 [Rhipicephalus microplus]|uniref:Uncharacterized protein n=1 Tax=Rhipicephalus microplus TaxID=6941 RepID=A0A9J6DRA3_RHIMP|nr:hypothetical protein HPB51_022852 [Rhipicephalus microplus]